METLHEWATKYIARMAANLLDAPAPAVRFPICGTPADVAYMANAVADWFRDGYEVTTVYPSAGGMGYIELRRVVGADDPVFTEAR